MSFKDVYYKINNPGSYGGVESLSRVSPGIKKKAIQKWLEGQDTYTIHKPVKRKFRRRKVVTGGRNHQFQADLVDLQKLKRWNNKTTFLLTCIDVFSKYAHVIPLKDKTGRTIVQAFKKIFSQLDRPPFHLQTDAGKEFLNKQFQKYLKENKVHHFTTSNQETKSSIVEIFNRTLKRRMFRYFTKHNTQRYIDILQDLVRSYNNTFHRSIKMTASQGNRENSTDNLKKIKPSPGLLVHVCVSAKSKVYLRKATYQTGVMNFSP